MKKTPEQKSNEKKAKKLALIEKRKQKKAAAKAKREAKKAAKLEKKRAKMALKKQKREEKKQKKLLRLRKQKERKAALREKKRLAREKKRNAEKAMKLKTKAQKKQNVENNTNDNVVDIRTVSKMMKRSLNDLAKKFASYDVSSFEKEANKIKSLGYEITVLDGNDIEVSFTYKSNKKLKNKIKNIVDNDDNDVHPIQPTENEPEVDEPVSVETVPAGDLLATDGEIDETGAIDIDDNDDGADEDDIIDDSDDENDNMIDYRDEQDEDIVDNRRDFFNTFGDDGEVSDY